MTWFNPVTKPSAVVQAARGQRFRSSAGDIIKVGLGQGWDLTSTGAVFNLARMGTAKQDPRIFQDEEEYRESDSARKDVTFHEGMTYREGELLAQASDERERDAFIMSHAENQTLAAILVMGGGFGGSFPDIFNFLPLFGPMAKVAALGKMAKTARVLSKIAQPKTIAAMAVRQGAEAGIAVGAFQPFIMKAEKQLQNDYSMKMALSNVAMATGIGAGFGSMAGMWRGLSMRSQGKLFKWAIDRVVADKPMDLAASGLKDIDVKLQKARAGKPMSVARAISIGKDYKFLHARTSAAVDSFDWHHGTRHLKFNDIGQAIGDPGTAGKLGKGLYITDHPGIAAVEFAQEGGHVLQARLKKGSRLLQMDRKLSELPEGDKQVLEALKAVSRETGESQVNRYGEGVTFRDAYLAVVNDVKKAKKTSMAQAKEFVRQRVQPEAEKQGYSGWAYINHHQKYGDHHVGVIWDDLLTDAKAGDKFTHGMEDIEASYKQKKPVDPESKPTSPNEGREPNHPVLKGRDKLDEKAIAENWDNIKALEERNLLGEADQVEMLKTRNEIEGRKRHSEVLKKVAACMMGGKA